MNLIIVFYKKRRVIFYDELTRLIARWRPIEKGAINYPVI